ncbi:hypothetical protein LG290_11960 [Halomonas sediminis]
MATANANLLTAGTVEFSAYENAANNDDIDANADVTGLVQDIEFITADTRMTQANLDRAETAAQTLVDNDERQYLVDGQNATVVVDAEGDAATNYSAVYSYENEAGDTVYTADDTSNEGNVTLAGYAAVNTPANNQAAALTDALGAMAAGDTVVSAGVTYTADGAGAFESETASVANSAVVTELTPATGATQNISITQADGTVVTFTISDAGAISNAAIDGVTVSGQLEISAGNLVDATGGTGITNISGVIDAAMDAFTLTAGDVTVEFGGTDGSSTVTIANLTEANVATGIDTTAATFGTIDGAGSYEWTGTVLENGGVAVYVDGEGNLTTTQTPDGEYAEEDLLDLQSATEIQANITATQNALDSDISAKGDNEAILRDVRDAILAYSADGNSLTDTLADGTTELGTLLETITAAVTTEDAEARETEVDGIVETFALDLYDTTDDTLEPTALEKAIQDSLDAVTNRDELEDTVEDAIATFDATVSGEVLNIVKALQDGRDALEQAIVDAQSDLSDAEIYAADMQAAVDAYEADAGRIDELRTQLEEEFGIENLVDLEAASEAGTAGEGDLYLYSENSVNVEMSNFEAEDILFLGTDFSRVDLGEDDVLADARLGETGTLEVFFQQDGDNAKLFVEQFEGAGSALNNGEITEVTLTGVNVADLQFENGQVSIIEAA